MGVCWAGKTENHKVHSIKQQSIKITQAIDESSVKSKMTDCLLTFNTEKNELNTAIDRIINEYNQSLMKEKLSKIGLEQIYNIYLKFKFDFHQCDYIILDMRKEQKESFLKRFKCINYTIKELDDHRINNLKKFLNEQNLIIILTNEDTSEFMEYLNMFLANSINIKNIYILDSNLTNDNFCECKKFIYSYIDDYLMIDYLPFILLSMKNFINLNSQQYLFYHEIDEDGFRNDKYFSQEYLTKKGLNKKNDKILTFLKDFKIEIILKIYEGENKSEVIEFDRKKLDCEDKKKNLMTIMNLNIKSISQDNIKQLNEYFKAIKYELTKNEKCVLIQFNKNFNKKLLIKIIMAMIFKITKIKIDKMLEYMNKNFSTIFNNINLIYQEDNMEINNILKEFGYK